MKTFVSLPLFALLAASTAVTACGAYAPDDIGTDENALVGVEPDEIDYDCKSSSETATAGYDGAGNTVKTVQPIAQEGVEPDEIDCASEAEAASTESTKPTTSAVTYGPVITIKPKG